jgi:hypothetical protein
MVFMDLPAGKAQIRMVERGNVGGKDHSFHFRSFEENDAVKVTQAPNYVNV